MENSKILNDIISLGCQNLSLCAATYKLYLELSEVLSHLITCHHSPQNDFLYIKARKSEDSEEEIYVPVLSTKKYSFQELSELKKILKTNNVMLAFCDPSSTISYYRFTDGFVDFWGEIKFEFLLKILVEETFLRFTCLPNSHEFFSLNYEFQLFSNILIFFLETIWKILSIKSRNGRILRGSILKSIWSKNSIFVVYSGHSKKVVNSPRF